MVFYKLAGHVRREQGESITADVFKNRSTSKHPSIFSFRRYLIAICLLCIAFLGLYFTLHHDGLDLRTAVGLPAYFNITYRIVSTSLHSSLYFWYKDFFGEVDPFANFAYTHVPKSFARNNSNTHFLNHCLSSSPFPNICELDALFKVSYGFHLIERDIHVKDGRNFG